MERIALICVGNRLMLDDGIGPAVFDELSAKYTFPCEVSLIDAGCMTMGLLPVVRDNDFLIVVDAVDGTGQPAGTVVRFDPDAIDGHAAMASLHDLRLADLLAAASLVGYEACGVCFGMQVANMNPVFMTEGLTDPVARNLDTLVGAVLAELAHHGVPLAYADGTPLVV
ncbi:MAG: hydrogenase maturation protease [Slackia sp.]|nr:hydrogenase maturation protease [Slackia sp.]